MTGELIATWPDSSNFRQEVNQLRDVGGCFQDATITILTSTNLERLTLTNSLSNNFCSQCGNPLVQTAVICPNCGSPTARFNQMKPSVPVNNYYPGAVVVPLKSKTTAVVLAVFLGIWSWLYTYDVNKKKFWGTLTFYLGLSVVFVVWGVYMYFQVQIGNYRDAVEIMFFQIVGYVWIFTPTGLTLWAIIDNATKPSAFYENYPKKSLL